MQEMPDEQAASSHYQGSIAIINNMTPEHTTKRHWWLIVLTGALSFVQLGAMLNIVTLPHPLAAQTSLILPLEFVISAVWALIFAYVTFNLIRLQEPRPAIRVILSFVTYSVARLFVFSQADYDRDRILFLALLNLLALPVAFFLRG